MDALQIVAESVSQARTAQMDWRKKSVAERLLIVGSFRALVAHSCESLSSTASSESHPPEEVLLSEILPLLEACKFLQNDAEKLLEKSSLGGRGRPWWLWGVTSQIAREPFGVIGVISPSNYPLFLPGVQMLQAFVAGNAVVWKPAPGCLPISQAFEKILHKAGLPENLLKVLPDTLEAGVHLTASGIDKIVFTGGFENGRSVLERLSQTAVPAIVELSGSDPVFVRDDADLETVVKALQFGLALNRGRTCMAPRRVFASQGIIKELEILLHQKLENSNARDSRHEQSAPDRKIQNLITDAIKQGARLVYGEVDESEISFPCVLSDVTQNMSILREDLFYPILFLLPVSSEEMAVTVSAQSGFALAASIFSKDLRAAARLSQEVKAGLVSINDLIVPSADPRIPFGGSGRSGYGVTRGAEGLLSLTRPKVVQLRNKGGVRHFDLGAVEMGVAGALIRILHGRGFRTKLNAFLGLCQQGLSSMRGRRHRSKLEDIK